MHIKQNRSRASMLLLALINWRFDGCVTHEGGKARQELYATLFKTFPDVYGYSDASALPKMKNADLKKDGLLRNLVKEGLLTMRSAHVSTWSIAITPKGRGVLAYNAHNKNWGTDISLVEACFAESTTKVDRPLSKVEAQEVAPVAIAISPGWDETPAASTMTVWAILSDQGDWQLAPFSGFGDLGSLEDAMANKSIKAIYPVEVLLPVVP